MTDVLDVRGLSVTFQTDGGPVHAVRDLSLTVRHGEVVGIVGESGSGKSVTSSAIMGLLPKGVVRKTFPTIHSTYDAKRLGLPKGLSVASNPTAIRYLVSTTASRWRAAGVPLLTP